MSSFNRHPQLLPLVDLCYNEVPTVERGVHFCMSSFSYKLVRSRRRSVALTVSREAVLTVRAPLRFPIDRIEAFIEEKRAWVDRVMEKARFRSEEKENHTYQDGEVFWYVGARYPLRLSERSTPSLGFSGNEFVLARRFHSRAKERFLAWYRREAKRVLMERVEYFARQYELRYKMVTINAARTRWGSCSGVGRLNFTFRLVMAPLSVIDYVVVHELAHLAHRNHSRAFWNAVATMYPDFESARVWLKKNGHLLEC